MYKKEVVKIKRVLEIWKNIEGYEGKYQISNTGKVKSLKNNLILKQSKDKHLYCRVRLYKKSTGETIGVHRLVAKAFIPNTNNLNVVNHIDENPQNNNIENLEWCTQKYNANYGNAQVKRLKTRIKPLIAVDVKTGFIKEFNCINDAVRNKFYYRFINQCLQGNKEKYKGFKWYYLD